MVVEISEALSRSITKRAEESGCESPSLYVERVLSEHVGQKREEPAADAADHAAAQSPKPRNAAEEAERRTGGENAGGQNAGEEEIIISDRFTPEEQEQRRALIRRGRELRKMNSIKVTAEEIEEMVNEGRP